MGNAFKDTDLGNVVVHAPFANTLQNLIIAEPRYSRLQGPLEQQTNIYTRLCVRARLGCYIWQAKWGLQKLCRKLQSSLSTAPETLQRWRIILWQIALGFTPLLWDQGWLPEHQEKTTRIPEPTAEKCLQPGRASAAGHDAGEHSLVHEKSVFN